MSLVLERLVALRARLLASNAFYAPRLTAPFSTLEEFSANVPFTTKAELVADQLRHPPFGTNHTEPLERYTRFCQTSGTTGNPLRWIDTPESWSSMTANWRRVLEHAGVVPGQRIFFAFSFGPFLGFWTAFDAATAMGCLAIPGGGMSSTSRLRTLIDSGVEVLCCTPTYAVRLADVAAAAGLATTVRIVIVAGEPGGSVPGTRAMLERLWPGARIADHHGMTETGPVTYECPDRPGVLHVMEPDFHAEVVDPVSGLPSADGQGELVLTTLTRVAAPVVRYRTGDIVRAGACSCGRAGMALDGGILARRDDMLVIRGVNVYPSAVDDVIRRCGGIAEYRVIVETVRSMVELRLEIEPLAPAAAGLADRLAAALRDAFGLRIGITTVDQLPRFEMKANRWIRENV